MLAHQSVQPRLVFLTACQSATRSTSDAFLGLAPKLVGAGVPAVVAMQDAVTVETARKLSAAFYRQLLAHGYVDLAVNEARSALLAAGRADAAVPVLFMRLESGQLLWSDEADALPPLVLSTPEDVQSHRDALRQQLADDAQRRWGGMSAYIQERGAALPIQASPYQAGQLGQPENLLRLLHAGDRLLVLGEPGTGKTVALERLAWELCDGPHRPSIVPMSLWDVHKGDATIPVLVRLFHYDGTPLARWAHAALRKTGRLRLNDETALNAFLQTGRARCFFLFDGLNEVPSSYRDRLVGELVRWMDAHPRHPVILTSRSQDELWRSLRAEMQQAVVVQPISDEQARGYLKAHLGEQGRSLYGQLDRQLRELARTPLILWLIKEGGVAREDVPGNRGELYARFVARMLRRDTERRVDAEILSRFKQAALMELAYHLGQEQRLACRREEAVEVAARQMDEEQAERVSGACARHGLLAGEDEVWFAPHQTVQGHFAALALQGHAEREWKTGRWERMRRALRGGEAD
ncbi:MAG: CHAT domain-containing protein, partial [Delftia sp.]|nr:CHAT domain-containing protein [Delftia sp.]